MLEIYAKIREIFQTTVRPNNESNVFWVFGLFPPPVNGQAQYNVAIRAYLQTRRRVLSISTGGTTREKLLQGVLLSIIALFFIRRRDDVYISLPGQRGVWGVFALAAVLAFKRHDYYVHHHSFRPINLAPQRVIRLFCRIGGRFQRHILLSQGMADKFGAIYLSDEQKKRSVVLPNAFLFSSNVEPYTERNGPITLGHLSVMTQAKGADYLLKLFRCLVQKNVDCQLELAGPIVDLALKKMVENAIVEFPDRIRWWGPVYDLEKKKFFRSVDVFVLPTQLIDEADPLVLVEAYLYGCEVLATDRGCIRDRLRRSDAFICFDIDTDVEMLVKQIARVKSDRSNNSLQCMAHAKNLYNEAEMYARQFFSEVGVPIDAGRNVAGV